jgi:hypothetical protein
MGLLKQSWANLLIVEEHIATPIYEVPVPKIRRSTSTKDKEVKNLRYGSKREENRTNISRLTTGIPDGERADTVFGIGQLDPI